MSEYIQRYFSVSDGCLLVLVVSLRAWMGRARFVCIMLSGSNRANIELK